MDIGIARDKDVYIKTIIVVEREIAISREKDVSFSREKDDMIKKFPKNARSKAVTCHFLCSAA